MTVATCPTRDQLRDYAVGKLDDITFAFVDDHIGTCEPCLQILTRVDDAQDTVLSRLRHSPRPTPTNTNPNARPASSPPTPSSALGAGLLTPTPDRQVSPDDLPQFPEYEILAKLGEGGMGTVYKARHKRLKRIVAIKLLPKERLADARAVARFEREMEAVGAVDHPHVVRAMHAGEDAGRPYLVVEYVDGLDLTDILAQRGSLPIADACELIRQAAVGLQHAHTSGLVHRDIKPSNLMLTRDGTVKILDLGLALLQSPAAGSSEMTAAGAAMGTADYIAPEQVTDSHNVDIRADIYSLGCTLYKLLAGRAPFVGPEYKNEIGKMLAHVQKTPPAAHALRTDVPAELAAVVERMMAKDPAQRYATPAEVAAALAPFAVGGDLAGLMTGATPAASAAAEARSASTGKLSGSAHTDTGVPATPASKPHARPRRRPRLRPPPRLDRPARDRRRDPADLRRLDHHPRPRRQGKRRLGTQGARESDGRDRTGRQAGGQVPERREARAGRDDGSPHAVDTRDRGATRTGGQGGRPHPSVRTRQPNPHRCPACAVGRSRPADIGAP